MTTPRWLTLVSLSALALASTLAHETGHGPKIDATGPAGGHLAHVVLASEAELGRKASPQFLAETLHESGRLRVRLLDKDQKLLAVDDDTGKAILFFASEKKPAILPAKVTQGEWVFVDPKKPSHGEIIFRFRDQRYVADLVIAR